MSIVSTSWQLLNTKPHDDYGYCCGSPTVPTNCGRYGRCYKVGRLYGYVGGLCACRIPAESQLFAKTTWSNSKKIILSQILCVFHFLQNSMAKKSHPSLLPPFFTRLPRCRREVLTGPRFHSKEDKPSGCRRWFSKYRNSCWWAAVQLLVIGGFQKYGYPKMDGL